MNLKAKFIVPNVIIILLCFSAITFYASYMIKKNVLTNAEKTAVNLSSTLGKAVDSFFNQNTSAAEALATSQITKKVIKEAAGKDMTDPAIVEALRANDTILTACDLYESMRANYKMNAIYLFNSEGKVVSGQSASKLGLDLSGRDYFKQLTATKKALFSDAIISKTTQRPTIVFVAPVLENGELMGGLLVSIDYQPFFESNIGDITIGKSQKAFAVSKNNMIVAHMNTEHINVKEESKLSHTKEIVNSNTNVLKYIDNENSKIIAGLYPLETVNWIIVAPINQSEIVAVATQVATYLIIAACIAAIAMVAQVVFSLQFNIFRPVEKIAATLREVNLSLNESAAQATSTSHQLAEGSTEQAASLEETSSSLEEISSQTKNNSENSQNAFDISEKACKAAHEGAQMIEQMDIAIQAIRESAEETSNIISTINDIAFQTNLLALNAAVEAARAGESGKGFAVVAEEVRNLAMRSADAVKNTSGIIEKSVSSAKSGIEYNNKIKEVLDNILETTETANQMVSQITRSSSEQATGIQQINLAMTQLDQITQKNAAEAEESASSAERLNNQANEMNDVVEQLVKLLK